MAPNVSKRVMLAVNVVYTFAVGLLLFLAIFRPVPQFLAVALAAGLLCIWAAYIWKLRREKAIGGRRFERLSAEQKDRILREVKRHQEQHQ